MAQLFIKNIFHHTAPRKFITDIGSNFASHLMGEVRYMLDINKVYASSYHPQSDRFFERVNSLIVQSLAMYVSSQQKDWHVFLPEVIYMPIIPAFQRPLGKSCPS